MTQNGYGVLSAPATLTIERVLPGPIERVWAYLTDSALRRKWLAAGDMEMTPGAAFELVWRNDQLTSPAGERPPGADAEHRMKSRIIECEPPRKLVFTWNGSDDVSFELAPKGGDVLLTIVHRRLPDRATLIKVAAGWHMHLDVLVARVSEAGDPGPFWDGMMRLRRDYDERIPV